jgi:hypothetical protein
MAVYIYYYYQYNLHMYDLCMFIRYLNLGYIFGVSEEKKYSKLRCYII